MVHWGEFFVIDNDVVGVGRECVEAEAPFFVGISYRNAQAPRLEANHDSAWREVAPRDAHLANDIPCLLSLLRLQEGVYCCAGEQEEKRRDKSEVPGHSHILEEQRGLTQE